MIHKQTMPYGCGVYAVANAMNLKDFVTDARLEESKNGNTIYQLNRWLEDDGLSYNIECMYHTVFQSDETGHGKIIPKECHVQSADERLIPILINVQYSKQSKAHLICGFVNNTFDLMILDSIHGEVRFTSWEKINEHYEFVYGIWIFQERSPNAKGYMCFEPQETVINQTQPC